MARRSAAVGSPGGISRPSISGSRRGRFSATTPIELKLSLYAPTRCRYRPRAVRPSPFVSDLSAPALTRAYATDVPAVERDRGLDVQHAVLASAVALGRVVLGVRRLPVHPIAFALRPGVDALVDDGHADCHWFGSILAAPSARPG